MTTLSPAGWYPDPDGGTRLRWWDGEDWSDHFRTRTLHTMPDAIDPKAAMQAAQQAAGAAIASRDIDRIVGAVQSSTRTEVDRAMGELQQAARGEVVRGVGEGRRQGGNVQPLISETVSDITRYVRWAFIIGVLLVIAYFVFQVIAGIGIAELVGDIADRIIDAVDDEESLGLLSG